MSTQATTPSAHIARLLRPAARIEAHEARAVLLSFLLFFLLLGSYYILRPVRDTMGTVYGVKNLQELFTAVAVATFVAVLIYGEVISRIRLVVFLPWVYGAFIISLLVFFTLMENHGEERWVAAAFYIWISTFNLFITAVFWSLMADTFSRTQGKRLFGFIAAGGSLGAIVGPALTALVAEKVGVSSLLLYAAVGFGAAVVVLLLLEREKTRVAANEPDGQTSRLDHALGGNVLDGFKLLFRSPYLLLIALFVLLATWVSTILYFQQADLVTQAITTREARVKIFASVDFMVNVCAIMVQMFGTGRLAQRFGLTTVLVLSPILMAIASAIVVTSPGLFVLLAIQVVRRASDYGITKPGREMLFTVVAQESRYKSKSVIDTAVNRIGDLSSAWITSGFLALGVSMPGIAAVGIAVSLIWGFVGFRLGRTYETRAALGETRTAPG